MLLFIKDPHLLVIAVVGCSALFFSCQAFSLYILLARFLMRQRLSSLDLLA
jgi:hypothetical protein